MNPTPFLIFDPGEKPDCSFATHVRDVLQRDFPCDAGACWQGSELAYEQAPYQRPKNPSAVP
jgi:hypothetical protein